MTDPVWIISSSALILAVILIRAAFGRRMKAWMRCALWALVLVRLLVPGTLLSAPVSLESAANRVQAVRDLEAVRDVTSITHTESGAVVGAVRRPKEASPGAAEAGHTAPAATASPAASEERNTAVILESATPERFEQMKKTLEIRDILRIVWFAGMAVSALWFAAVNIRFYIGLRRKRERIFGAWSCRVYSVEGIESSCCFLNSVYVSEETAKNPAELECVLQHELAHRRHGDCFTAFLRNAALIIHWYNPLAWLFAFLSRRDSELFADEGAIKALGEERRESYGRTLIALSRRCSDRAPIACAATTMTGGKREIRERITNIALPRKAGLLLTVLILALALAAAGCAFVGGNGLKPGAEPTPEASPAPTPEPRHAPEETKHAAEAVIKMLVESDTTFDPTLGISREDLYASLKRGRPAVELLEERQDSHLALLDLYEEYAGGLTQEKYAAMDQNRKRRMEDASYNWREEDPEGFDLYKRPMMIESLLTLGGYFSRFEQAEKDRFTAAFLDIHNKITGANLQVFGEDIDRYSVRFIDLGGEKLLGKKLVFEEGVWMTSEVDVPHAERRIVLSPGNEFTAKEGYDVIELYFENGNRNLPEYERIPLGAEFLLPVGWSVRAGRYDGNGYYPDETIGGVCLAARCNSKGENMFSVYDENGECVGTIGYNGLLFSEKDREEWGYDSMSAEEQARTKMMCCFALVSGNTSSADIMGEEARLVPAGTGRTVVTRATYSGVSKEDGTKDCFTFPLAATFDGEYDFGFFIEFADGAVTEAQLEDIARSMRIGRITK